MITAHELKERLSYDPETGIFVWKTISAKQRRTLLGMPAGCLEGEGYVVISIRNRGYKAHRLAWLYMTGNWPRGQIDHINRVRSDNRFSNLRSAEGLENAHNKGPQRNNKCGHTGVLFQPQGRRHWRAYIYVGKKSHHIGMFDTLEEAVEARAAAKQRFHVSCPPALR